MRSRQRKLLRSRYCDIATSPLTRDKAHESAVEGTLRYEDARLIVPIAKVQKLQKESL